MIFTESTIPSHFISTTKQIKGANWKSKVLNFELSADKIQETEERTSINILDEILCALKQEIYTEIELGYLNTIKEKSTLVNTYDQSKVGFTATFVGEEHVVLGQMIADAARPTDNTVIVSPTALTILQSAFDGRFVRTATGCFDAPTNTKLVGKIGHLNVYVNQYACDSEPVLIGYIAENEEDREVAFIYNYAYGEKPNAGEGWLAVGIDTSSLRFL